MFFFRSSSPTKSAGSFFHPNLHKETRESYPFHGVGRASKMSRETLVGFVTALRLYLQEDEEKTYKKWHKQAQWITAQFKDTPGVTAGLDHQATVEDDEPMVPVSYIKLNPKITGITGAELSKRLRDGAPSIEDLYEPGFMLKDAKDKLMINPQYLDDEDAHTVVDTIKPYSNKPANNPHPFLHVLYEQMIASDKQRESG